MTLAALETTLRLYRDEEQAIRLIPTLKMLTMDLSELTNRATRLANDLNAIGGSRIEINQVELSSKAGGGALPLLKLPSKCLRIKIQSMSANKLEKNMRQNSPPIIGRIEDDGFVIDLRTLLDDDLPLIRTAFEKLLK
jgi:L-seryl-tRNA(Ser) seleniumtransferase